MEDPTARVMHLRSLYLTELDKLRTAEYSRRDALISLISSSEPRQCTTIRNEISHSRSVSEGLDLAQELFLDAVRHELKLASNLVTRHLV